MQDIDENDNESINRVWLHLDRKLLQVQYNEQFDSLEVNLLNRAEAKSRNPPRKNS